MVATLADFREQFPEFQSTSDDVINRALNEALHIHSRRTIATLFCTAHILSLEEIRAGGGEISPEKTGASAGSLSVNYKTQADEGWEAFFTSTSYGKHFLILEKRNARTAIGAFVV